jgi:hypothetical protein
MKIPKIHEDKKWDIFDVQNVCIKHELYTRGTNDDCQKMLDFVHKKNPTTRNLYLVAKDILEHSYTESTIGHIMFLLSRDAVYSFYEIVE